mgnify:FL=1
MADLTGRIIYHLAGLTPSQAQAPGPKLLEEAVSELSSWRAAASEIQSKYVSGERPSEAEFSDAASIMELIANTINKHNK